MYIHNETPLKNQELWITDSKVPWFGHIRPSCSSFVRWKVKQRIFELEIRFSFDPVFLLLLRVTFCPFVCISGEWSAEIVHYVPLIFQVQWNLLDWPGFRRLQLGGPCQGESLPKSRQWKDQLFAYHCWISCFYTNTWCHIQYFYTRLGMKSECMHFNLELCHVLPISFMHAHRHQLLCKMWWGFF